MYKQIIDAIEQNPIIGAVENAANIDQAIASQINVIFLLCADIFNGKDLVERVKQANKNVFLHMDFLEGIGKDEKAIDYIAKIIRPHGIISTKNNHIKYAKKRGLFTIQRFFLIDNLSYSNAVNNVNTIQPDLIEIMPGLMPGVIRRMNKQLSTPVIAGGLIDSKEDIIEILKAGALGISTSNQELWSL